LEDDKKDKESKSEQRHRKSLSEFSLEEYRLVPVEEYHPGQEKEKEIDLIRLAKHIWSKRLFVVKITGIFIVLGLFIAFLSPVEYKTEAFLMPEVQSQQDQASGLLQKYGGFLGLSGSSLDINQQGMISPSLYPKIVRSLPFQLKLLNQKIHFESFDTIVTVFDYFNEIYSPSIFSYIYKYTLGLRGVVKKWFTDENKRSLSFPGSEQEEIIQLSWDQKVVIEKLRERITVNLDEESGVITVSSEMPDARAAAIVGNRAITLLTDYLKEYRTQKALVDLEFIQGQHDNARQRFQKSQMVLAEFRDQNRNVVTARAQTELERLQNERDLAFNVYNSLAQQLEQAKIALQEQTPVFKILQPVQVPIEKSSPRRTLIMIISIFLGITTGLVWLFLKYISYMKWQP
jgi:uncharacterized protein involved in exopolysaccharide biosynthesis